MERESQQPTPETPSDDLWIYVADLAAYNNRLHGVYIDPRTEVDEQLVKVVNMLA